jgi:hypothetical protein
MSGAALLLAAAVAAAAPPPPGAVLDSAQVSVTILRPVAVRQGSGPEARPDSPRHQLTRRDGVILLEFQ